MSIHRRNSVLKLLLAAAEHARVSLTLERLPLRCLGRHLVMRPLHVLPKQKG